jgi:hypothetical protein
MDLHRVLSSYAVADLQKIVESLGLKKVSGRSVLVERILKQMEKPAVIHSLVASLPRREYIFLELIQLAGGKVPVANLKLLAQIERWIDDDPPPPQYNHKTRKMESTTPSAYTFDNIMIRLMQRGLVLSPGPPSRFGGQNVELKPHEYVFIPEPVLNNLPPAPPVQLAYQNDAPPTVYTGDATTFHRDLYLYWSYVRDNDVNLTKQDFVSKTHLKKINATLMQPVALDKVRLEDQAGRLYFLRCILEDCGLIAEQGGKLSITPNSEAFFARSLAERARAVMDAYYQKGQLWDELLQIPYLYIPERRSSYSMAPDIVLSARKRFINLLKQRGIEGWIDIDRLNTFVQRTVHNLLIEIRSPAVGYGYGYYGGSTRHSKNPYNSMDNKLQWTFMIANKRLQKLGMQTSPYQNYSTPDAKNGWKLVEGSFIQEILCEPLHWMGLVDLGFAQDVASVWDEFVDAVRFTQLGAHVLLDKEMPAEALPQGGRLIVQPTFEVLAYPPVQETHLALLDRVAERSQIDQVATYRLTRGSLYRACQQHDMTVAQVIEALEKESGASLPQNVAYTLEEWGRALDRVTVRDQVQLLYATAELLDQLEKKTTSTQQRKGKTKADDEETLIVRRLTPTTALVRSDAIDKVEHVLFVQNSLPVVHKPGPFRVERDKPFPRPTGHWLDISPQAHLTFRPGAPVLYLKRHLAPFTVEEKKGLRLTSAVVKQAVSDGMSVEQIESVLKAWSGGRIPDEVSKSLKVWGDFFGNATVERTVLLHLSDERTLRALLEDEEVRPLLQVHKPDYDVVTTVRPADLTRLRKLLNERGIDVEEKDKEKGKGKGKRK